MKPVNFGHMITRDQKAYPVNLKQSRLVEMIVSTNAFCKGFEAIVNVPAKMYVIFEML